MKNRLNKMLDDVYNVFFIIIIFLNKNEHCNQKDIMIFFF